MNRKIPAFLVDTAQPVPVNEGPTGKIKDAFIDRTIRKSASFVWNAIIQYERPKKGLHLTLISAQSMLIFFLTYIVCITLTHRISGQLFFSGFFLILILLSPVKLLSLYRNVFMLSFLFGFLVMVPAALNIFTPGKMLFPIIRFQSAKSFLIYHIPAEIGITDKGIMIVARMFMKVFNSLTLTFLILRSTTFYRLIKALRIFRVPAIFILIITLSYKFIFIMAHTIEEMYLAMRSRWIGNRDQRETRKIIAGRMGFLFRKSWMRYEEIYKAMVSRGFTGEFTISGWEKMSLMEAGILLVCIGFGIANVIIGG
jgi:cobalt/nickel transport system permease protein